MRTILLLLCLMCIQIVNSQELNCRVNVDARQVEGSEKIVFEEMQKTLFQLINGRKWTNDEFETEERIECSINIILKERVGANQFKGNIQIQASRPVYNSNYKSQIVNLKDENFTIKYNQFEPLIYNETGYSGELASIIGFYVYMIIGYDYDTYSLEGGTKYFQKAQQIVNFAQSSSNSGWKAFEDQKNRYWLIENALSARFKPMRKTYYNYHMRGFDLMQSDINRGRKAITQSLKDLKPIHNVAPSSYNMRAFFNAKLEEVIKLYEESVPVERSEISELLIIIDPGNTTRYDKLRKGK